MTVYIIGKNVVSLILSISLLFPYINGTLGINIDKNSKAEKYTYLGNPMQEYFDRTDRTVISCDMALWEDKLYIGGGDYDANTGPVPVMSYDINSDKWENTGVLPEEQINRFCVINGSLVTVGVDPQEDWSLGNYYILTEDGWEKKRNIPNGVHTFDMTEFGDMIFAGTGVESGYPVVCSKDGGQTFTPVAMEKDGQNLDTSANKYIRVYDLIVFENELYALFYYDQESKGKIDLYKYETENGGAFIFETSLSEKITRKKISYDILREKIEFDGKMYFATGFLYETRDMNEYKKIELGQNNTVYDLYYDNGRLYVLCGAKTGSAKYKTSVWEIKNGEYVELFDFTFDVMPMSFVVRGEAFYFSMGDYTLENQKNGSILSVKYKKKVDKLYKNYCNILHNML